MSGWTAKRFWKAATVTEQPGGFGVSLDGRPLDAGRYLLHS